MTLIFHILLLQRALQGDIQQEEHKNYIPDSQGIRRIVGLSLGAVRATYLCSLRPQISDTHRR